MLVLMMSVTLTEQNYQEVTPALSLSPVCCNLLVRCEVLQVTEMRFIILSVLVFIIMLAGESSCEGRQGSLSSPVRRVYYKRNSQLNNQTLASNNRLRALVRRKVKRIFKTKKLPKPSFGAEMIEKLNR